MSKETKVILLSDAVDGTGFLIQHFFKGHRKLKFGLQVSLASASFVLTLISVYQELENNNKN